MAKYRATVKASVEAKNPASAQRTLEEHLKSAGLDGWRVVSVEEDALRRPVYPLQSATPPGPAAGMNSGVVLLLVSATLAALFFLTLALY